MTPDSLPSALSILSIGTAATQFCKFASFSATVASARIPSTRIGESCVARCSELEVAQAAARQGSGCLSFSVKPCLLGSAVSSFERGRGLKIDAVFASLLIYSRL